MFKLETSCPCTWIEELSLAHIAHSFNVWGSCTICFWNTRNYKMPIWGANGRWFRAYKDWAKCRLESRTDWRTVEAVSAFVESTLNIPARTPAVSPAEMRFSLADRVFSTVRETETPQPARGPKTRMFDTSVLGQRLSWLLNFERQLVRLRSHSVKWRNGSSKKFFVLRRKIKIFHHVRFRLSKWILNHQPNHHAKCSSSFLCTTKLDCLI